MKSRVILSLILAIIPLLVGHAKPAWKAGSISRIEIRDEGFGVTRTITAGAEVEAVVAGMRAAKEVTSARDGHLWTHKLDFDGSEQGSQRWLYDAVSGEFTQLSKLTLPIYRLDDDARRALNTRAENRAARTLSPASR